MEEDRQQEESEVAKKVKSLLEKEEEVLARAVAQTMKNYHENPTHKNLRDWNAAKEEFEEFKRRQSATAAPRFRNLIEILEYLKKEGWKVEKSKLYADAKKRLISKEKDGTFSQKAVDEYAKNNLERLDGQSADSGLAANKARIENDIASERLKKIQRENEIEAGLWVRKSEAEQKHTAKLGLLLTAVDNFIYGGKLEESAEKLGGDKAKMAEFKADVKKEFRAILGEYAKQPVFTVPKKSVAEAEELIKEVNAD